MVVDDPKYMDALRLATETVGNAYGAPGQARRANHTAAIAAEVAMVGLLVVELESEERRPGAFLEHPAHLPEDERELRALYGSSATKDKTLRSDLVEWGAINKRVAADNAFAMRVPIIAFHKAAALAAEMVDAEHDQMVDWQRKIRSYMLTVFKVDPREAPTEVGELDVWCRSVWDKKNPCPEWLYDASIRPRMPAKNPPTKRIASPSDIVRYADNNEDFRDGE